MFSFVFNSFEVFVVHKWFWEERAGEYHIHIALLVVVQEREL